MKISVLTRKDGHHPIIFMNCGPVRYKVDDKKQASERPFAHKVIVRETDFKMPASFEAMLSMKFRKPYYKAMSATKSLSLM